MPVGATLSIVIKRKYEAGPASFFSTDPLGATHFQRDLFSLYYHSRTPRSRMWSNPLSSPYSFGLPAALRTREAQKGISLHPVKDSCQTNREHTFHGHLRRYKNSAKQYGVKSKRRKDNTCVTNFSRTAAGPRPNSGRPSHLFKNFIPPNLRVSCHPVEKICSKSQKSQNFGQISFERRVGP